MCDSTIHNEGYIAWTDFSTTPYLGVGVWRGGMEGVRTNVDAKEFCPVHGTKVMGTTASTRHRGPKSCRAGDRREWKKTRSKGTKAQCST